MSTWFQIYRKHRHAARRRRISALDALERRCMLDAGAAYAQAALVSDVKGLAPRLDPNLKNPRGFSEAPDGRFRISANASGLGGVAVKAPHFYEDYVGPRLAQLNAVATVGEVLPDGDFLFAGVNAGAIDPSVTATYVFGVDRNGALPTGPFPGRPDIRFDALVVVKVVPGQATTATVIDLTGANKPVPLPAGSIFVAGREVAVIVPASALPSTGLPPSQYRFNYWPEDGKPGSTHIASFAPEFNDARIGVLGASSHGLAAALAASLIHRGRPQLRRHE